MSEGDVGDAAFREPHDRTIDSLRRATEVEAALDAVHEGDLALRSGGVDLAGIAGDRRRCAVLLGEVLLDEIGLREHRVEVAVLGFGAVRAFEIHLVEGRVEDGEHDADTARA